MCVRLKQFDIIKTNGRNQKANQMQERMINKMVFLYILHIYHATIHL